jgi:hypothetical protein
MVEAVGSKKGFTCGKVRSICELAVMENGNCNQISRLLPLAFLAPDIVGAIVGGTQPADLTPSRLRHLNDLPYGWSAQRRLLGFASQA